MYGVIEKICVKCGVDCANLPRVKDPQGRYTCKSCHEGRRAAAAAARPELAKPAEPDVIPLEDDAMPTYLLEDVPDPESQRRKPCPACARMMAHDQVVCLGCGYNASTGMQAGTGVGADVNRGGKLKCVKCGYSLKGLRQAKCPECGAPQQYRDIKDEMREESRRTTRNEYIKPFLHLVIGYTVASFALAIMIGRANGFDPSVFLAGFLVEGAQLAFGVPIGVVVFFVCSAMWIGFDQAWYMVALRLAGIYAVSDAVYYGVGLVPIPWVPWAAMVITYVGLLSSELDLEISDAVIVALITVVVKVVLAFTILANVQGWFS